MRTTIRMNDALLERARRRAAESGLTFTAVVERAVEQYLREPVAREPVLVDLPSFDSGTRLSREETERWYRELREADADEETGAIGSVHAVPHPPERDVS
jgi:hypothetical protein